MTRLRRATGALLGFLLATSSPPVSGQPLVTTPAPQKPSATHAFILPYNAAARHKLKAARDYIQAKAWPVAVRLLQTLLDAPEDSFIPAADRGKETNSSSSVRAEAEHLLAALPRQGMESYQAAYDGVARKMYEDARTGNDVRGLSEVVRRYRFTSAGADALNLLGTHYLDRGRSDLAALCYQRLLDQSNQDHLPPLTLFKAALAFRAAGDHGRQNQTWQSFVRRVPEKGLRVGERQLGLEQLRRDFESWSPAAWSSKDWPLYRGDPSRSAASRGEPPLLETRWRMSTVKSEVGERWLKRALDSALTATGGMAAPVPLAIGNKLIYRAHDGLHALDTVTGKQVWDAPFPLSLDGILRDSGRKQQLERWLGMYQGSQGLLYQNSVLGTLSSDGRLVFAIEDLALPPHPGHFLEMQNGKKHYFSTLKDAIYHNRLRAIDVASGTLAWEAGGRDRRVPEELRDAYFLGPPLALGGSLYVVVERNQELAIVCLGADNGEVIWSQKLAEPDSRILVNLTRRVQAIHPAYQDGILICPTHCGAIVAVDLLSRSLVWGHTYKGTKQATPDETPELFNPETLQRTWKGCSCIIQDGHVVFTAPDENRLLVLKLSDGSLVWETAQRDGDLYLAAVHGGKVVVVGTGACRAYNLATGKELWQHTIETPAGQGVLCQGGQGKPTLYYLPLQSGDLYAVNLDNPRDSTRFGRRGEPGGPLGNLIFHDGTLWSQSASTLTAYLPMLPQLARIEERLARSPRDPEALVERANLRLARGEVSAAIADLHLAQANQPGPGADGAIPPLLARTRSQLFLGLTHLLQKDFVGAESHLEEYRALCQVPIPAGTPFDQRQALVREQRRRLTQYHALVAQGRETQGRFEDALVAYRTLQETAEGDLLPHPQEPGLQVRAEVWVQMRFADLVVRANPDQVRALRVVLEKEWRGWQASEDVTLLVHRYAMRELLTGADGPARTAIRVELADRLGGLSERRQALAALLPLHLLQDRADSPHVKARALHARGRLLTLQGQVADAADSYHQLERVGHRETLPDGSSVASFLDDLASDKRFLGPLNRPLVPWEGRKLRMHRTEKEYELPGSAAPRLALFSEIRPRPPEAPALFPVYPEERTPSSCRNIRFQIDGISGRLHVQYRDNSREGWSVTVPQAFRPGEVDNNSNSYRLLDHLAILTIGHTVVGLDLIDRRIRWTWSLLDEVPKPPQAMPVYFPHGGVAVMTNEGRILQRCGLTGPMGLSAVYLQTKAGLVALDPVTGEQRWLRTDVPRFYEVFGDDQHVYLAELVGDYRDGAELSVSAVRAFRASDGRAVDIPDCASLFANKVRILGRCLLLSEGEGGAELTLRLHDVHTGKDLWKKSFPRQSMLLQSADPNLVGVVQPDGMVNILDLPALREQNPGNPAPLTQVKVERRQVEGLLTGYLLRDRHQYYVALQGPPDPLNLVSDGPYPNFTPDMNYVPINGTLYSFDRATGGRRWAVTLQYQALLLEQFEDLPVLLFSAFTNRQADAMGRQNTVYVTCSMDKRTGKTCYLRETMGTVEWFHTLLVDPHAGTIDLIGSRVKVRHVMERVRQGGMR
jgi:outer membrane protein assembly factor BamB